MVASLSPIRNAFCRCNELLINYWNAAGRPLGFKMSYLPKWHMWPFNTDVTIQSFLPPVDLRGIRDEPLNVEWQQSDVKSLMTTASLDDRRPKTSPRFPITNIRKSECLHPNASLLPGVHETPTQCWIVVGPPSATLAQHWSSVGSASRVCWNSIPGRSAAEPRAAAEGGGAVISNGS